jgi:hypothetical protein
VCSSVCPKLSNLNKFCSVESKVLQRNEMLLDAVIIVVFMIKSYGMKIKLIVIDLLFYQNYVI